MFYELCVPQSANKNMQSQKKTHAPDKKNQMKMMQKASQRHPDTHDDCKTTGMLHDAMHTIAHTICIAAQTKAIAVPSRGYHLFYMHSMCSFNAPYYASSQTKFARYKRNK